jgi:hypothetical protein
MQQVERERESLLYVYLKYADSGSLLVYCCLYICGPRNDQKDVEDVNVNALTRLTHSTRRIPSPLKEWNLPTEKEIRLGDFKIAQWRSFHLESRMPQYKQDSYSTAGLNSRSFQIVSIGIIHTFSEFVCFCRSSRNKTIILKEDFVSVLVPSPITSLDR